MSKFLNDRVQYVLYYGQAVEWLVQSYPRSCQGARTLWDAWLGDNPSRDIQQ